jgi:hypothetical protein
MERGDILRLLIEVDRVEPLSGRIGDPDREMVPFCGWVGLGAQLDRLLATAGESAPVTRAAE